MGIGEGTFWDEHWVLYGNQFDNKFHILKKIKIKKINEAASWGSCVSRSVGRPTSAQVMISQLVGSSPTSGSVLIAQSLEPALDSVCVSLSLPLPCLCSVSLSPKK